MKLSIVIPAFNEQRFLPRCLASIDAARAELGAACETAGLALEVVVCDNNSTDATAELARAAGARVVFEPVNQISRARNAAARAARGDWLLFIDADSRLHAATLAEMLRAARSGRFVGGGARVQLDGAPWWGRCCVAVWNGISRTCNWAAGSFLFCRADVFQQLGGFSEEYYAAEELELSSRLKRWGRSQGLRFVILRGQPHVSSGRKFELYSTREILTHVIRSLLRYGHTVRSKKELDFYYDGRR